MELPRRRILFLSALGGLLGVLGGVAALVLIRSIGLLTNLAFFHRVGWTIPSFRDLRPTPWIPVVAVAGGLVVALLARWCPMIRGTGSPRPWMRSSPSRVGSRRGPRSRSPFLRPWPSGPVGRSARRVPSSSRVARWDRSRTGVPHVADGAQDPPRERRGRRHGGDVRHAARGRRARDRTAPVRVLDARVRAARRGGGGGRWDARGVLRCGPAAPRAGPRKPGAIRAADLRRPRRGVRGPRGDRHERPGDRGRRVRATPRRSVLVPGPGRARVRADRAVAAARARRGLRPHRRRGARTSRARHRGHRGCRQAARLVVGPRIGNLGGDVGAPAVDRWRVRRTLRRRRGSRDALGLRPLRVRSPSSRWRRSSPPPRGPRSPRWSSCSSSRATSASSFP